MARQLCQRHLAHAPFGRCSIDRVANHGVFQGGEVHTNLVRPPGVELDLDERSVVDVCEGAPVRARRAEVRDGRSAPGFSRGGHARAMDGIAPDGELDPADLFFETALYESKVGLSYLALLERFPELGVCGVVLGDQDDSRSLLVEAMHDSRAQPIATLGQLEPPSKQRVHQSARDVSGTGMHGHSRGFVDGDDVFIFVEHFERDGFGSRSDRRALGNFDGDLFAPAEMQRSLARGPAVDAHAVGVDQLLHAGAAQLGAFDRNEAVETDPGVGGRSREFANHQRGVRTHAGDFSSTGRNEGGSDPIVAPPFLRPPSLEWAAVATPKMKEVARRELPGAEGVMRPRKPSRGGGTLLVAAASQDSLRRFPLPRPPSSTPQETCSGVSCLRPNKMSSRMSTAPMVMAESATLKAG